jgi:hypothetical protein
MRSRNRRTSPDARRVPPDHQPFAGARFGRKYTLRIIPKAGYLARFEAPAKSLRRHSRKRKS